MNCSPAAGSSSTPFSAQVQNADRKEKFWIYTKVTALEMNLLVEVPKVRLSGVIYTGFSGWDVLTGFALLVYLTL